jgi:Ca2+-binding RTX toxin-like protein
MRDLLILSITALLGGTVCAAGTVDLSAAGTTTEVPVVWTAGISAAGVADVFATLTGASAPAAAEADRPTCRGRPATLVGTSGDDVLVGTPQEDVIVARAGNDVIRSRGGVDFVCGGAGDDRISGGPNSGTFTFTQNSPRGDRLLGNEGNDRIVDGGDGYRDLLLGGPGDDRLTTAGGGYAESRALKGGPGADRLTTHVGSAETGLLGGSGPDTLTSNGHNQFLAGLAGSDVLTLAGTGDTVLGLHADGDRVRITRAGYVVLLFGSGPVEVDLAAGTARLVGAATGDVLTGLSPPKHPPWIVVYGTEGDDRLSGRDFTTDQMNGRSGNDFLAGRGGGDILSGNYGDDVLDGGEGDDDVYGGRGVDTCMNAEDVTGCSP